MSSSIAVPTSLSRNELLATCLGGAIAFPAILGLGQLAVFKPLRLTCGSSVASICGGVSVLAAGCVASATAVQALSLTHRWQNSSYSSQLNSSSKCSKVEFGAQELLTSTVASAILFRALGGRFLSVLPSHLLKPGAFAHGWIPARSTQATERERLIIRELGKSHGCHSCGTRGVKQFHADHQPPNKILNGQNSSGGTSGITQRLYPQCQKCSSLQGSLLSHSNGSQSRWSAVRTHPLSLRAYHVFLPIPIALVYLKSENHPLPSVVKQLNRNSLPVAVEAKRNHKSVQTSAVVSTAIDSEQPSTSSLFSESKLPSLIRDFPLLIVWNRIVYFLDSFPNAGDAFHITVWAFAIIAALGTI